MRQSTAKIPPYYTTAMDGFEQTKKRPHQFRCTLCAGAPVMDRDGMMRHFKEAEHKSKVKNWKEKDVVGWGDWEGGGQVAQDWGGQRDADEIARWMPSEEELERDRAERDKRDWILNWIEAVEVARLAI